MPLCFLERAKRAVNKMRPSASWKASMVCTGVEPEPSWGHQRSGREGPEELERSCSIPAVVAHPFLETFSRSTGPTHRCRLG
jgi:hypothetical protein